ncbi:MAG: hypothetical protein IJC56_09835 [Clostridia bacterium]|nr:hypothetical protein [Clostridia bacterium]
MGRAIDRVIFFAAAVFILYLLFISATGSIFAALIMTFTAMVLLKKLISRVPREHFSQKRRARMSAESIIEQLSLADHSDARAALNRLIAHSFPDAPDGIAYEYILSHPSAALSPAEIISIWQGHKCEQRLLIISLPAAGADVFSLASRLQSPEITLLDGRMLARLIAEHPGAIEPDATYIKAYTPARRHIRLARAASRAKAGKCALTGAFMLILFMISGAAPYLIGSMLLLFIAGLSLRKQRMPKTLFGD